MTKYVDEVRAAVERAQVRSHSEMAARLYAAPADLELRARTAELKLWDAERRAAEAERWARRNMLGWRITSLVFLGFAIANLVLWMQRP